MLTLFFVHTGDLSCVPIITENIMGRAYVTRRVCESPKYKMHKLSWKLYMFPFVYFLCILASLAGASGK